MTVLITLFAILISGLGIGHLTRTDAKRIRAHKLEAVNPSRRQLAWTAVYLPGLLLLIFDQWTAAMMWLGAMPFVGWAIAATPPEMYVLGQRKLDGYKSAAVHWGTRAKAYRPRVPRRQGRATSADTTALKARIDALETRIAELESQVVGTKGVAPEPVASTVPLDAASENAITPLPDMAKAG